MRPKNLRKNFLLNSLGSIIYALTSLVFLIIVTRINGIEQAGVFSFAFAFACLLTVIGTYYGRTYQISETNKNISNTDFIVSKVITSFAMILFAFFFCIIKNYDSFKFCIILLLTIYKAFETFSDSFYALMHKNDDLYKAGLSLLLKGIVGIFVFLLLNLLTKNLIISVIGLALVNILLLFIYDYFVIKQYNYPKIKWNKENVKNILRHGSLIFYASLILMIAVNMPRYIIDTLLTDAEQGIYGIIIMPATLIIMGGQFLIQPLLNELNKYIKNHKRLKLKKLINKFTLIISTTVIFGLIVAYFIGIPFLELIYGIELNNCEIPLLLVILGGTFYSFYVLFSNILIIQRRIKEQLIANIIIVLLGIFISLLLITNLNVNGAVISYLIITFLMSLFYTILFIFNNRKANSKKKNKILIISQHFYPEEFKINDIAFEMSKRGYKVTVLTGLPNYPKGKILKEYKLFKKSKEFINGVKVIRCSLVGRGNNNFTIALNYAWFAISSCLKVLFIKKDFNQVYVYQLSPISMAWAGILVKKIKKIPLTIHVMDLWPASMLLGGVEKGTWQYKFFYKMSRNTYKQADKLIISSKGYKDYFSEELKLNIKNIVYIPNYAEDIFNDIKAIKNEKFDLLFAGNIGPAQNIETIIETANILKHYDDLFFHIVGDGLSLTNIKKLAKKYKLNNIKFYGRYPLLKMKKFYNLADAFLITMEDNEVVNKCEPGKLSSYMSAGKPIFGAINGAVKEIINKNKCGIIVSSSDHKKLSQIIVKNYKNNKKIEEWSKNAKDYYLKYYSKEKNFDKIEKEIFNI